MKGLSIAHGVCRLAASLLMLAATVTAQDPQPLLIARQGYFFVGGKYFDAVDGRAMSGQMYVKGNGHMLMLEKNNGEIAAVVEEWLRTLP